jgi:four helix bundle protein
MGDYQRLEAWQLAHELTIDVYRITLGFPREEVYGLSAQLRRAVASVESNISEGFGYGVDRQACRYRRIARGSANEVECQLLIARDLGYLKRDPWLQANLKIGKVRRMLSGLINSLGKSLDPHDR